MRRLTAFAGLGALCLVAAPAAANTVTFGVSALCTSNCQNVDLEPYASVLGRIELSTAGFVASGPVGRSDLLDFEILFGSTPATILKGDSAGYDFTATWGATTAEVNDVSFVAMGEELLDLEGPFITAGPGGNLLSLQGACHDAECAKVSLGASAGMSALQFRHTGDVAPVPLPPAALLLGAGVGALALAGGRRRRRPSVG